MREPLEELWRAALVDSRAPMDDEILAEADLVRPGASIESVTRGSRSMFFTFCQRPRWPDTISSPSSPTQTHVTCGLPSGLTVTMCASASESMTSRALSGRAVMRPYSRLAAGRHATDYLSFENAQPA